MPNQPPGIASPADEGQGAPTHPSTPASSPLIKGIGPARILAAALLVGVSFDVLFHEHALGASFPVFIALVLLVLVALSALEGVRPIAGHLALVVAAAGLAAFVAVRANPLLTLLNVVSVLCLLALISIYYARDRLVELPLVGYPLSVLVALAESAVRPPILVRDGVNTKALQTRGMGGLGPFARGLLLSVPVVLVLVVLLSAADMMFNKYLTDMLSVDLLHNVPEYAWRSLLVLIVSWGIAGGLSLALRQRGAGVPRPTGLGVPPLLDFTESAMVLAMVVAVFSVFVWIQFTYLFGGEGKVVAEGFTYAAYARRGFFELIAVAILSLALILGLGALTRREHAREQRVFSLLGTVVVALVLVMLISAFRRLQLYEAAYGYTQLRVFAHVFMVWLAVALAWLAATQWRFQDRFAIGAFACALGFLFTLNAINPDALIVRLNLQRYEETGDLDAWYLARLSNDAVPAMVALLDVIEDTDGDGGASRRLARTSRGAPRRPPIDNSDAIGILRYDLWNRHERLTEGDRITQWQSYHVAHHRAHSVLEAIADQPVE